MIIVCGGPCAAEGPNVTEGDGKCPKCGANVADGFGLAGGGYGPYQFCEADGCDYFAKQPLKDDEE